MVMVVSKGVPQALKHPPLLGAYSVPTRCLLGVYSVPTQFPLGAYLVPTQCLLFPLSAHLVPTCLLLALLADECQDHMGSHIQWNTIIQASVPGV